ncbi:MAG: AraC family transcriptional regulator [Clostridia bacterium]|nr:AraC family transcriptional regulator [Clostridia bacterium]
MLRDRPVNNNDNLTDYIPLFTGAQDCKPNHKFGPHIRDYYIIHFVVKGKGVLCDKNGSHNVVGGELFIIRPGEVTTYFADNDNPWYYMWIAFKGKNASIYDNAKSVYTCPDDLLKRIFDCINGDCLDAGMYSAILHELSYHLFAGAKTKDANVLKIKEYIDYNYMHDLKVESLSKIFGFERSYLFRIFKAEYGISLKEYIVKVRIERAKKFLLSGYSVVDTAFMVGYKDEFNFSRGFKKYVGVSPMGYKKGKKPLE